MNSILQVIESTQPSSTKEQLLAYRSERDIMQGKNQNNNDRPRIGFNKN